LRNGKEEEIGSAGDEELSGGFRRRPFSFFPDHCSGGKNSESLAMDVSVDALDLVCT
jgi:hypothetical protein